MLFISLKKNGQETEERNRKQRWCAPNERKWVQLCCCWCIHASNATAPGSLLMFKLCFLVLAVCFYQIDMKVGIDVKFSVDVSRRRRGFRLLLLLLLLYLSVILSWFGILQQQTRTKHDKTGEQHIACGILSVQRTWYNFRIFRTRDEFSLLLFLIPSTCSCLFTLSHLAGSFNTSFSSFRHILNQPNKYLVLCASFGAVLGSKYDQQIIVIIFGVFLSRFLSKKEKEIDRYNYRFWWIFCYCWALLHIF